MPKGIGPFHQGLSNQSGSEGGRLAVRRPTAFWKPAAESQRCRRFCIACLKLPFRAARLSQYVSAAAVAMPGHELAVFAGGGGAPHTEEQYR